MCAFPQVKRSSTAQQFGCHLQTQIIVRFLDSKINSKTADTTRAIPGALLPDTLAGGNRAREQYIMSRGVR
jgi:hypothetical protein